MKKTIVFVFAHLACYYGAMGAQVPLDESDKEGVVEIFVVDALGVPFHGDLSYSVRRFLNGDYAPEIRIGPKTKLKYGTYHLTVRGSPGYPVDKTVRVRDEYQLVLISLFLAPIELPRGRNIVKGKLPTLSKQRSCNWVRLVSPVSENEYADAKALTSGDFLFENIKGGKYVLITIGDQGICEMAPVTVMEEPIQDLVIESECSIRRF